MSPATAIDRPARSERAGRPFFRRALKPAVFIACSIPILEIARDAAGIAGAGGLGANPIEEVMNRLGFWTLTMLTLTLACTPAKILFAITWPIRVRRMLGLFAFAYALLHFSSYLVLDQFFDWTTIREDIAERPFITVGFAAFLLLIPLAITSTNRAVRRMGFARWKRLHRLVYLVAALGLLHFVWRVKADLREPSIFIGIIAFLMAVRLWGWRRSRRRAGSPARRRKSAEAG